MKFKIVLLAALAAMLPATANALSCVGSTTITSAVFTPEMRKEIQEKTGVVVEVTGSSSGAGFKDLLEGKTNCSMTTNSLDQLMRGAGLSANPGVKAWELGADSVVPIVHRNNSIKGKTLTKEQWAGIFSGKIANWSEVGGPNLPVVVIISADEGSATRQEVQRAIMGGAAYVAGARTSTTTKDEVAAVGFTPGGVGAVGRGLVAGNAAVAQMEPLFRRSMALVTKGEPPAGFQAVFDHLSSAATKSKLGLE